MSALTNGKLLLCAAGFAVVAAIAAAIALEPPHQQREYRLDANRERDLASLDRAVNEYWKRRRVLPANLEVLAADLALGNTHKDPETDAAYIYEVTGKQSFRLCANFARASRDTERYAMVGRQFEWAHESERRCFDRTVKDSG